MKLLFNYNSIALCLVIALSSCDDEDLLTEYDTHKDKTDKKLSPRCF